MGGLKAGKLVVHALALALLSACASGGGGGGGGATPPGGGGPVSPPPPPPGTPRPPAVALPAMPPAAAPGTTPDLNSREFRDQWGLAGINAQAAWAYENGHGQGVLVGVIDDGIDSDHPELIGRISPASIDIAPGRNALETDLSHGSEIASLIAGNFNGSQTMGVAYEATILAVRADEGAGFPDTYLADAIDYAVAQGVDVINLSLGSSSPTSNRLRTAIQNATQAGVIIVVSAGNSGASATNPNYPGFLATDAAVSNGLIIIAGGSNPDGSFNPVSNPAGSAAMHYLVAPGWQIMVPDHGPPGPVPGFQTCGFGANGDLCRIQGTSYASPHVAGAVAVLMSAFPGLTPLQVVEILLQTTDDMGAAGIDNQTGWGHLNLARAFAPIGAVSAPMAGQEVANFSLVGALGPAFGDGFAHSGAWSVSGFDAYNRTYAIDVSRNWISAPNRLGAVAQAPHLWRSEATRHGVRVQAAFADDSAPATLRSHIARADFQQDAMRIEAEIAPGFVAAFAANGARAAYDDNGVVSHLDAVRSDMSLRLTREIAQGLSFSIITENGRSASGLVMSPSIEREAVAARASFALGRAGLDLTYGQVREDEGVLGLLWSNNFGATPGGETRFAGFGAHVDLNPVWRISGLAEFGVAEMTGAGFLEMVEPLRTTAFSLQARARPAWLDGAVTFTIAQPLRVEDGVLAFMAPTATRYGRQSLSYEYRSFSPTPSGRELRFGVGYSYWRGNVLSAFGEAFYVLEPGHVARAEPDAILRFGLRVAN